MQNLCMASVQVKAGAVHSLQEHQEVQLLHFYHQLHRHPVNNNKEKNAAT